jgi:hypothetical protein
MATHWNNYISAVEASRAAAAGSEKIPSVPPAAFGVLGSAGFAAGGFLVSPYCDDPTTPDIQLTVFPMVSPGPVLLLCCDIPDVCIDKITGVFIVFIGV